MFLFRAEILVCFLGNGVSRKLLLRFPDLYNFLNLMQRKNPSFNKLHKNNTYKSLKSGVHRLGDFVIFL